MNPEDERDEFRKVVKAVDHRVTDLDTECRMRHDAMRSEIQAAVRSAMPSSLMSDDEHRWVRLAIEREGKKAQFRQKIIESTAVWAIPVLIGGLALMLWHLVREYTIRHGMWLP